MPVALARKLRNDLRTVTLAARERATTAARAALENLAVHEKHPRAHFDETQRSLRNRLRARGRALGDTLRPDGAQSSDHLVEAAAYEHWHRLLFTRFLTENHLLLMPDDAGGAPTIVTLQECEELAAEMGARDGFDLACRFAGKTLPGVFRADDPVLELVLALNDLVELRKLLASLSPAAFTADDSLGWTYQFWQETRKDEVNKSGAKIGADELSAVTQLFTEDYMVEFLLHNTLGAWWAGKLGPISAATEAEARARCTLPGRGGSEVRWTYLRFVRDDVAKTWSPAAGTFSGWPKEAKLITFLDPCMGSGHFVVFALPLLARMRMEEEHLSVASAIHATLRDNLFNLELDERCAQIAAFNIALSAWKIGGYQPLPRLHLACSGLAPHAAEQDWVALAGDNDRLKRGMERLYRLFQHAPTLGSLINPRASGGDLVDADFHELQPLLEKALAHENKDDATHEMAVTARGLAKAAEILDGRFTLVATNVPFLGRDKQHEIVKDYLENTYPLASADLATCFAERCFAFAVRGGATALVTPQSWLYQDSFKKFRPPLLERKTLNFLGRLGPHAFEEITGEAVNVCAAVIVNDEPSGDHVVTGIDVAGRRSPDEKRIELTTRSVLSVQQRILLKNPQAKISFGSIEGRTLMSAYAVCFNGIQTGDYSRFGRCFWEMVLWGSRWSPQHSTVNTVCPYGGMEHLIDWDNGTGAFVAFLKERLGETGVYQWLRGQEAWGRNGVIVSATGTLSASLYLGDLFDNNVTVIIPKEHSHLPAIWSCCESPSFHTSVRLINQALKITDQSMIEIPFDLEYWQEAAAQKYPQGLPKPFSADLTQWLFNGHPASADQPLHVAAARLLGYKWPRQTGSSFPDCPALSRDGLEPFADHDGIVCLPPINREQTAATRLRSLLAQALDQFDERELLARAGPKGSKSSTLENWLRDEFFDQHCDLFHQRPFIWHVWDGLKDGFHALVNYHRFDHGLLQKLTYTYVGEWIRQQAEDAKPGVEKPGAAQRLGAAKRLQAELAKILEGEAPYDIFVRWKALKQQPIGWHPDCNDGVRLNIRPFLTATDVGKKGAGILRAKPNIKWDKDRGNEPVRPKTEFPWFWCAEEPGTNPPGGPKFTGSRWNDVHFTLDAKRKA